MAKGRTSIFYCTNCGNQSSKWEGRCRDCGEWNTIEEELYVKKNGIANSRKKLSIVQKPRPINEISESNYKRFPTGLNEFDRVIGGGIVEGSLLLIGGEPGIGKSTLLTEIMGKLANRLKEENILYISGEESVNQVADRSKRLNINGSNYYIFNESNWQKILEQIEKIKPKFMVLDSIQTTVSSEVQSAAGSISQVKEVTYELMNHIKQHGITCFVIGHITKDGTIAGPKVLEHMVDTVIYFEGDQFGQYRILRAMKNRFGSTNEVGIFEMADKGLREVLNPSQYFLEENLVNSFGRCLSCINEGSRSLFIEVQALVVENKYGSGRRTTQGVDSNRLAMMVAIIEKYLNISLGANDIYLNVIGGIKVGTRESDLSIIASLISSYKSKPVDNNIVFIGEVGLTGEVRSVPNVETRLKEMSQLNYKKLITSQKIANDFKGKFPLELIGIKRVKDLEIHL